MKKAVLTILLVAVAGLLVYWLGCKGKEKPAGEEQKEQPVAIGANTDAFNTSFRNLLTAYYNVKDALFAGDTARASAAALTLATASDSLKLDLIQGDSTGVIKETAKIYTGTIVGSATALAGENSLDNKRKEFANTADALWTLIRTVKYSGEKLYWDYCPMAFNNKGAYWVSNELTIKNPYFGSQMPTCGNVEDSLDYSKK
ncbi:MAG: DUF3347 domain-containing protein [Chitinophagaceae bacterium]